MFSQLRFFSSLLLFTLTLAGLGPAFTGFAPGLVRLAHADDEYFESSPRTYPLPDAADLRGLLSAGSYWDQFATLHGKVLELAEQKYRALVQDRHLDEASAQTEFLKSVVKDEISVQVPSGEARLVSIGDRFEVRYFDRIAKINILSVNTTGLDEGTPEYDRYMNHLAIYTARQRIGGARSEDKRGERGRDMILFRVKDGKLSAEPELLSRPPKFSAEYWKVMKVAVAKKVGRDDLIAGGLVGLAQTGVVYGIGYAGHHLVGSDPASIGSLLVAGTYGFLFTWQGRAYRELLDLVGEKDQARLSGAVGFSYGLFLNAINQAGHFHQIEIVSAATFMKFLFWPGMNTAVDSKVGVYWRRLNKVRERTELTEDAKKTIDLPGDVHLPRAQIEYDAVKLGRLGFRAMDLMAGTAQASAVGGPHLSPSGMPIIPLDWAKSVLARQFPPGRLIFWGSMPAIQWASVKFAEAKGYSEAPAWRSEWEQSRWMRFWRWIKRGLHPCEGALLGDDSQ